MTALNLYGNGCSFTFINTNVGVLNTVSGVFVLNLHNELYSIYQANFLTLRDVCESKVGKVCDLTWVPGNTKYDYLYYKTYNPRGFYILLKIHSKNIK